LSDESANVRAYICYSGEPGEGVCLVYARGSAEATRLAAEALGTAASCLTAQRYPPGDGVVRSTGVVTGRPYLERAGLTGDSGRDALNCPSCGLDVGDGHGQPALCLCPRCGLRICEGQV